jgi:hypothetical protein
LVFGRLLLVLTRTQPRRTAAWDQARLARRIVATCCDDQPIRGAKPDRSVISVHRLRVQSRQTVTSWRRGCRRGAHVADREPRRESRLPGTGRLAPSFAVRVCPDDVRGSASARRHSLFPTVRQRPEDYPIVTAGAGPTDMVMWNGVGGSTVHWEGHFPHASVGFPGGSARRSRRRLANRILESRGFLQSERPKYRGLGDHWRPCQPAAFRPADTSAAVNPTSTIGAVALRCADGIRERKGHWG